MRASTSTCGVCVSSERTSSSIWFRLPATSRTMSTLVRSSTAIEPRGESSLARASLELVGLRVADRDEARLERRELELLLAARDGQLALLLEVGERRDADQVALAHHAEALGLQHDVERLIPGHVAHADRDVPATSSAVTTFTRPTSASRRSTLWMSASLRSRSMRRPVKPPLRCATDRRQEGARFLAGRCESR